MSPRRVPEALVAASADAALRQSIRSLPVGNPLRSDNSCLIVRRGGRLVLADQPDASLIPASTQKILTAGAALEVLGPEHRFVTTVSRNRPVRDGVLDGPLYLKGGGDPLVATPDFVKSLRSAPGEYTSIEEVADLVVNEGIRSVAGGLVVDDDLFDDQRGVSGWDPGYRVQGQVGDLGALALNNGFGPTPSVRTLDEDPGAQFATALRSALVARGIVVGGGILRGNTPAGATEVAEVKSPALPVVIDHMLTASDNTVAEILLKHIAVAEGRKGSTAEGADQLRKALAESGLVTDGLVTSDGSGLSRANRASCRIVEGALAADGRDGPIYDGLALAGETGTLAERLAGTPAVGRVRAKTGSLAGVSGLVGWANGASSAFTFATIANNVDPNAARAFEDQLATVLVAAPEPPLATTFAP